MMRFKGLAVIAPSIASARPASVERLQNQASIVLRHPRQHGHLVPKPTRDRIIEKTFFKTLEDH